MKKGITADEAVRDLEKSPAFDSGKLTSIKKAIWSPLSDFTHCGGRMIDRHFSGDDLVPSFPLEFMLGVLNDSDLWALSAASSLCSLAENLEGAAEMIAKLHTITSASK
ncbi:MAG: hypothetical protein ABIT69_06255 [Sphingomicrobium sp.]